MSTCTEPRTVPLCGNSIGTDRRFLAAYLPDIENYLHYRSVDVSSVKELVRRWYPTVRAQRPRKAGSHRALDDIRESVAELRYYRERVFAPLPSPGAAAGGRRRRAGPRRQRGGRRRHPPTLPPHRPPESGERHRAQEDDEEEHHEQRVGERGHDAEASRPPPEHRPPGRALAA